MYARQNEVDNDHHQLTLDHTGTDTNETELEKLVFGDVKGFRDELKLHHGASGFPSTEVVDTTPQEILEEPDTNELENLDDADLFFFDSEPSAKDSVHHPRPRRSDEDGFSSDPSDDLAWKDSDDERISFSLASTSRSRKLRVYESEDVINGKEYVRRLRRHFERLHPIPEWANLSVSEKPPPWKRRRVSNSSQSSKTPESDEDGSFNSEELDTQPLARLLQNAGSLVQSHSTNSARSRKLRPENVDLQRLKDVGNAQQSSVTSLAFHPAHPLLLSSGPSSTISLHHISPLSPTPNPLLTTLHLRATSLTTSHFLPPTGNKIFFSGRRRYFHVWDLHSGKVEKITRIIGHGGAQRSMERFKLSPCGRWMGLVGSGRKGGGIINILDANTCQWIAEVRVEGKGGVADLAWWGDGEGILVMGKGGEAVEWDRRQKRVVARWVDEGAVGTTVVVLGGNGSGLKDLGGDRWVAVGSSSGIVNIYDRRSWAKAENVPTRPKPLRVFDQLTTPTSHLNFSPDGQILCMASRWKRDALRLIHLPSCTVYRNWPTSSTPLGRITAIAWSPNSQMLSVSNEQGKIRLWEICG